MKGITTVFFDLDHTLWDFDRNSELTYRKILPELRIQVDFKKFAYYYGIVNAKYWQLFREEKISHELLREKRLEEVFKILKIRITKEQIIQISELYIKYLTDYNHLIANAFDILDYLKPNYKLYLLTNGLIDVQKTKIEKSGLDKYFKAMITSDDVGCKKPNKEFYNYAMKIASVNNNECVMIGDGWEPDIIGSKRVGITPLFFNPHNLAVDESVITITDLIEIKKYL